MMGCLFFIWFFQYIFSDLNQTNGLFGFKIVPNEMYQRLRDVLKSLPCNMPESGILFGHNQRSVNTNNAVR